LANTKSAKKEIRVNERKRQRNKSVKSLCRTNITKAENLVLSGDTETGKQAVAAAVSSLDRAADKGVIHPNNASRRKSRLMKKLNEATSSPAKG
jgi:small subunit ribosomal protein S20